MLLFQVQGQVVSPQTDLLAQAKDKVIKILDIARKYPNSDGAVTSALDALTNERKAIGNAQGTNKEAAIAYLDRAIILVRGTTRENLVSRLESIGQENYFWQTAITKDVKLANYYANTLERVRGYFFELDSKYTNFDNVPGMLNIVNSIDNEITSLTSNRTPAENQEIIKMLKADCDLLKADMSAYWKDGFAFTSTGFNRNVLDTKIKELFKATDAMNKFDHQLNTLLFSTSISDTNKTLLNGAYNNFNTVDSDALNYVATLRFGSDAKGLANIYAALGETQDAVQTTGAQYQKIAGDLGSYGNDTQLAKLHASLRAKISNASTVVDKTIVALTSTGNTVLTYDTPTTRDTFDPSTRIGFINALSALPIGGGGNYSDKELLKMVEYAAKMPPYTAQLLLGDRAFFDKLGSSIQNADMRTAIFKRASELITLVYTGVQNESKNGVTNHVNFDYAYFLKNSFMTMGFSGSALTLLKRDAVRVSEEGKLNIIDPMIDMRRQETPAITESMYPFTRGFLYRYGPNQLSDIYQVQKPNTETFQKGQWLSAYDENDQMFNTLPREMQRAMASWSDWPDVFFTKYQNNLSRYADAANILGGMEDAYNRLMSKNWEPTPIAGYAAELEAGNRGDSQNPETRVRLKGETVGTRPGQWRYGDIYHSGKKNIAGPVKSPFTMSTEQQYFAAAAAQQSRVLGMDVLDGWANFNLDKNLSLADTSGNALGGTEKLRNVDQSTNSYLNSTFGKVNKGSVLWAWKQDYHELLPQTLALPGGQFGETDERKFDVKTKLFVNLGSTNNARLGRDNQFDTTTNQWGQLILQDHEYKDLNKMLEQRYTRHIFNEIYTPLKKSGTLDSGYEIDSRRYLLGENKVSGTRLGGFLLLERGKVFGGVAKTTENDLWGAAGWDTNPNSVTAGKVRYLGIYSISEASDQSPSFELDSPFLAKTQAFSKNNRNMLRFKQLDVGKSNTDAFMGMREATDGTKEKFSGGRHERAYTDFSYYVKFEGNQMAEGFANFGTRTQKPFKTFLGPTDYSSLSFIRKDNSGSSNATSMGTIHSFKTGDRILTISGNVRPNLLNTPISQNQIKTIMSSTQALINTANKINTSDVLAYRASLLSFGTQADQLCNRIREVRPVDDLSYSSITSLSVNYSDKKTDFFLSASKDQSGQMIYGGYSFRKDPSINKGISIIAGYGIRDKDKPAAAQDSYNALFGVHYSPTRDLKFSVFGAQTTGKELVGTLEAKYAKLGGISINAAKDYVSVYATGGFEKKDINVRFLGGYEKAANVSAVELGAQVMSGAIYATAIYRHMLTSKVALQDMPDVTKINQDFIKLKVYYKLPNSKTVLFIQSEFAGFGKEMGEYKPDTWFVGAGIRVNMNSFGSSYGQQRW